MRTLTLYTHIAVYLIWIIWCFIYAIKCKRYKEIDKNGMMAKVLKITSVTSILIYLYDNGFIGMLWNGLIDYVAGKILIPVIGIIVFKLFKVEG